MIAQYGMSYWTTFVRILKTINSEHFDTSFDQIDQQYRRNDYCYANGPKIIIAVSPNDIIGIIVQIFILGLLHNN